MNAKFKRKTISYSFYDLKPKQQITYTVIGFSTTGPFLTNPGLSHYLWYFINLLNLFRLNSAINNKPILRPMIYNCPNKELTVELPRWMSELGLIRCFDLLGLDLFK